MAAVAAVAAGAAAVAVAGGKGCKAAAAHAHGWLRERRKASYEEFEEMVPGSFRRVKMHLFVSFHGKSISSTLDAQSLRI